MKYRDKAESNHTYLVDLHASLCSSSVILSNSRPEYDMPKATQSNNNSISNQTGYN